MSLAAQESMTGRFGLWMALVLFISLCLFDFDQTDINCFGELRCKAHWKARPCQVCAQLWTRAQDLFDGCVWENVFIKWSAATENTSHAQNELALFGVITRRLNSQISLSLLNPVWIIDVFMDYIFMDFSYLVPTLKNISTSSAHLHARLLHNK